MATKAKKQAGKRQFRWRPGARFPVPARVAGQAIQAISRRDGGVTPQAVVDEASDPDHPLHSCFEWDDTEAAVRYRMQQARVLINSIRIEIVHEQGDESNQQVAFVSVAVREQGRGYLPADVVMADTDYRQQAVAEALIALEGWRTRYAHLRELAGVFQAIDAAKLKVKSKAA